MVDYEGRKFTVAALLLLALAILPAADYAQELDTFENDIPFGFRMSFFRGNQDSTKCVLTLSVDNENLLFYRGPHHFEARYEAFLNMRETSKRTILKGVWDKQVQVPSYDETSLTAYFDPLQETLKALPGKYEGFVEIKDLQANTFGNGRVSVTVPDFSQNLPKLSTPFFYEPGAVPEDTPPPLPAPDQPVREAALKYPAGKPIYLLVDVYADSAAPPSGWKLTAEVVKALMLFPRIEVDLDDGLLTQRKLIQVESGTMGLGTYEIDVQLRDKRNNSLARATTFKFSIIRSAQWVERNYEQEVRYLKYLVSEKELERLLNIPKEQQADALKDFWKDLDPVPATAINELRVQYFERIDYANRHFTTEQKEGWETNMGEVYILLGPPSEIYGSRLNQIWVYERENLILHFFGQNLRNRQEFDNYIRDRRWWRDTG